MSQRPDFVMEGDRQRMETIKGFVDHIIFRNEENGYTVAELRPAGGGRAVTCVGTFPVLTQGTTIEAEGEMVRHAVYGKQFSVSFYTEVEPADRDAIERYLASGAIKGIKEALAARIVRRFGEDTMRVIEEEPEQLALVKGISLRMAKEISAQAKDKSQMRSAMVFLQKYGISLNLGVKIYQKYGDKLYTILQENPYQIAEDIRGVGFIKADSIAKRMGVTVDSDYRIRSGLLYCLGLSEGDGHCYLPEEILLAHAEKLLEVSSAYMEKHLMDLSMEGKLYLRLVGEETRVYPRGMYHLELSTARMLMERNVRFSVQDGEDKASSAFEIFNQRLRQIEENTGTILEERQKEAVLGAMEHGLLILTGGPGTGKTTTIKAMICCFEQEGLSIELAAPTGRAAKRMTEAAGMEARTIHRLLELTGLPDQEKGEDFTIHFARNAQNPIEADVIIIDEMSMVDLPLMHSLLLAVSPGTRLILVGDENQLPSVGPGNVLRDIIRSGCFTVVELTRIFRQASHSDIVVNAHKIHRGENVALDNKSKDFFFLKRYEANQILGVVLALVKEKLPGYVEARSYEIQVLTPMRKGVLGVENLNRVLQKYLNPPDEKRREIEEGDRILREGDKVMQIRNNYQLEWEIIGSHGVVVETGLGVFNGDLGILRSIDETLKQVTVVFEENRYVVYEYAWLSELELAYAVTIHKSQGSEYPAIVLPLLSGPAMLMNRNLLYTAVTRAKRCVAVVGSDAAFSHMIENESQQKRYSSLDEGIQSFCL